MFYLVIISVFFVHFPAKKIIPFKTFFTWNTVISYKDNFRKMTFFSLLFRHSGQINAFLLHLVHCIRLFVSIFLCINYLNNLTMPRLFSVFYYEITLQCYINNFSATTPILLHVCTSSSVFRSCTYLCIYSKTFTHQHKYIIWLHYLSATWRILYP